MHRSFFAPVLALSVFATGCAVTAESTESAVQNVEGTTKAPVLTQVVDTVEGAVLANAAGLSLYTFDNDTTSESTCYNGCAARWPAALVTADEVVAAPFGTTTRTDGELQLTLDGHPLYLYAGDAAPGDVNGEGLGGVWHLARPIAPPAPALTQVVTTTAGDVLASAAGLSLYTFDRDVTTESTCYQTCAVHWPPVLVTTDDVVAAPFATTTRTDGTLQLTLGGKPLYTYFGDAAVGDITGDGLGGVWHLARPALDRAAKAPAR